MPAAPQTLLIPFTGGLDTYSNPQLLKPGTLTASMGTMLDRPGAAYPGPGYSPTQWAAQAAGTRFNHGIATYATTTAAENDQLLLWSTAYGGTGPAITVPGDSNSTPLGQTLAPWRQSLQRFQDDSLLQVNSATKFMAGPPTTAVIGNYAYYAWLLSGNGGFSGYVAMVYQNLVTRAWSGPYYLAGSGNWITDPTSSASSGYSSVLLTSDSTYLRLAVLNGTTVSAFSYNVASNPLTKVSGVSFTNVTAFDAVSVADEYAAGAASVQGAFVVLAGGTLTAYGFSPTSSDPIAGVTLKASGANAPIAAAPVQSTTTSSGFMFVTFNGSTQPVVITTGLDLSNIVATTVTATLPGDTAVQVAVTNPTAGSAASVALAIEYKPTGASVFGKTVTWNYVYLASVTLASPNTFTATSTLRGWGGLALLSKFYGWYNGAEYRPLIAVRSGWFHYDGTWGTLSAAGTTTLAYPNGYLYDYTGQLLGKFGDADVGTDALWPAFSAAGYAAGTLNPLPGGFHRTLSSGQQTLTFAFPQYGYLDFVSSRMADAGSPIGTRAGLSTVTWSAPTFAEPPAQSVQFNNTLVIPGTLTAYYDGSNTFEAGFLHRSPTPYLQSNGGGGSLPNSTTYFYQTVLVYQDASGRMHQAAPSRISSITTTANNDKINIAVPFLRQTLRTKTTPIAIRVFRSAGNPGIYANAASFPLYQVTSISLLNDAVSSTYISTAVTDTTSDANLTQCATIYTFGQQPGASIGTYAPPPFDSLTAWNGQLWGLASRNGPELWCSWPSDTSVLQPEGPAWSLVNRVAIPADIGQPKALRGLDEKLFILGTRTDYGLIGTAPTRDVSLVDAPDLFAAPSALPTPGGIKVLNGVTRLPKGLLLQGTQGFVLLGRDLQYKRVGVQVNDFARINLYQPGVFFPEQQAVLLFSSTSTAANLLYFYETEEWAQAEQPPADTSNSSDSAIITGTTRAVTGQSSQAYVLPGSGLQPLYFQISPFSKYLKYRTPWIELRNLQSGSTNVAGYGILREVHILGTLPRGSQAQILTLYTEYDFDGNTAQPPESQTLIVSSALDYQWRFGFSQGQARRVRFTVTINSGLRTTSPGTLPPILLTGLELSYDVDTGLSRLGPGNSIGS